MKTRALSIEDAAGGKKGERQPLVSNDGAPRVVAGTGASAAVISLVKICVGPGILALPLAFNQGGIGFSVCFLGLMALWANASVRWLLDCKQQLPPTGLVDGDSTYIRVGRLALGAPGAWMAELSVAATLLGVCAVYLVTASDLLKDTCLSFRNLPQLRDGTAQACDVTAYSLLLLPLALARDVGFLAPFSAAGVAAIVVAFGALVGAGALSFEGDVRSLEYLLHWQAHLPKSIIAFSAYYGVAAFAMGLPLVALNVEESMREPNLFSGALRRAVWLVWAFFALCGAALAVLYYSPGAAVPSGGNVLDDVSAAAPPLLLEALRGAVALCALLTYPLALVPVGQMAERRWLGAGRKEARGGGNATGLPVANGSAAPAEWSPSYGNRVLVRAPVVAAAAALAIAVPRLGTAVSLIGCCSMSIANYVLPPLFHLAVFGPILPPRVAMAERVALLAGILTVLLTTGVTGWSVVVRFIFTDGVIADDDAPADAGRGGGGGS